MSSRNGLRVLGLVAALMLGLTVATSQAPATSYTWEGDVDQNWDTAGNWVLEDTNVPGSADDAVFDITGVYNNATVNINGSREVATVTLSTTGGNYDLTGGVSEVLTVNTSITQADNSATISAGVGTVGTGLTINVGGDLTLSGAITGSGGITKTGAGTLTLSGACTFTDGTTISAGTLKIGGDDRLPTARLLTIADGATFDVNGNNQTLGGLSGTGGASVTNAVTGLKTLTVATASGTDTFAGVISGDLNVTKTGAGTLILGGASTYTGTTTIGAGTLKISGDDRLPTARLLTIADGATFDVNGNNQTLGGLSGTSGAIVTNALTGLKTLTVNNVSGNTFDGVISGDLNVTKTGAGTLILGGTNTFAGTVAINGGSLSISNDANLGDATNPVAMGGATLKATDGLTTARAFTLTGANTVDVDASKFVGITGGIGGTGDLAKAGAGSLLLSGASSYTGTTTVSDGTVQISGGDDRLPTATRLDVGATGTFDLNGNNQAVARLTGVAGATVTNGLAGLKTLTVNQASGSDTYAGAIGGDLNVTKTGAGTLILGGASSYTGTTTVSAGALVAGSAASLPGYDTAGRVLVSASATLGARVGGSGWTSGELDTLAALGAASWAADSLLGIDTTNGDFTYGSVIGDADGNTRGLVKLGANALTLSGASSYTGTTRVSDGTLKISGDDRLPTATRLDVGAAGTFDVNGNNQTVGSLSGTSGAVVTNSLAGLKTLTVGTASGTDTFAGVISGDLNLTKTGAGTLKLSGTNTFAGTVGITGGILSIAKDANLGNAANPITMSGATLQATGNVAAVRKVTTSGSDVTFDVAPGASLVLADTISGSQGVIKTGGGNLYLGVPNTFGGTGEALTIQGGRVILANNSMMGAPANTVVIDGGELLVTNYWVSWNYVYQGAHTINVTGNGGSIGVVSNRIYQDNQPITGSGNLTKTGAGFLYLTGASTYSGTLTVAQAFGQASATQNRALLRDWGTMQNIQTLVLKPQSLFEVNNDGTQTGTYPLYSNIDRLNDNMALILDGGELRFRGKKEVDTDNRRANYETIGDVTVNSGASIITVYREGSSASEGVTDLTIKSLTRNVGASVIFATGNSGTLGATAPATAGSHLLITTNPTLNDGIIGGWATVNTFVATPNPYLLGENWATYGANGVGALTTYQTNVNTTNAADNVKINNIVTASATLTDNRTYNSLVYNTSNDTTQKINLAGKTLTIDTGGILKTGAFNGEIQTTVAGGRLTAGDGSTTATAELFTHVNMTSGKNLTISATITNNTASGPYTQPVALVKDGTGRLILNPTAANPNTYSGGTYINMGALETGTVAGSTPLGTGPVIVNSAWLDYKVNQATTSAAGVTLLNNASVFLSVTPGATDKFTLGDGCVIAGSQPQLAGLFADQGTGGNLVVNPGAIIAENAAGGVGSVKNLANNANLFFGLNNAAAMYDGATVGTGTPFKGLSTDHNGDRIFTGFVTANSDFTLQGAADVSSLAIAVSRKLTLGGGAGVGANSAAIKAASPVTADIVGRVSLNSDSATYANVTFAVQPDAILYLGQANALGGYAGTAPASVVVYDGGLLDLDNALAINGPVTVLPGGYLLNDQGGLNGSSNQITMLSGAIYHVTSAAALTGSQIPTVATGTVLRMAAPDITNLNTFNQGAYYELYGGDRSEAAGIQLNGGMITNDSANRTLTGGQITVNGNSTFAATPGTTLYINNVVVGVGSPVLTIGSYDNIDGNDKYSGMVELKATVPTTNISAINIINTAGLRVNTNTGNFIPDVPITMTEGGNLRFYINSGGGQIVNFGGAININAGLGEIYSERSGSSATAGVNINGLVTLAGETQLRLYETDNTILKLNGGIRLNGDNIRILQNRNTVEMTTVGISDDGNTRKLYFGDASNAGTLSVQAAGTYTGGTEVNAGTLIGTVPGAFGTGAGFTVTGGTGSLSWAYDSTTGTDPTTFTQTAGVLNLGTTAILGAGTVVNSSGGTANIGANGGVTMKAGSQVNASGASPAGVNIAVAGDAVLEAGSVVTASDTNVVDIGFVGNVTLNGDSGTWGAASITAGPGSTIYVGGTTVGKTVTIEAGADVISTGGTIYLRGRAAAAPGNALTVGGDLDVSGGGFIQVSTTTGNSDTGIMMLNTSTLRAVGTNSEIGFIPRNGTMTLSASNVGSITLEDGGILSLRTTIGSQNDLVLDKAVTHSGDWVLAHLGSQKTFTINPSVSTDLTGLILRAAGSTLRFASSGDGITFGTSAGEVRLEPRGGTITLNDPATFNYSSAAAYTVEGWGKVGDKLTQMHNIPAVGTTFYANDGTSAQQRLIVQGVFADANSAARFRVGENDILQLYFPVAGRYVAGDGMVSRDASTWGLTSTLEVTGGSVQLYQSAFDTTNGGLTLKVISGNDSHLYTDFASLSDKGLDVTPGVAAPLQVTHGSAFLHTIAPVFTVDAGKVLGYTGRIFPVAEGTQIVINGQLDLNGTLGAEIQDGGTGQIKIDAGETLTLQGGGTINNMKFLWPGIGTSTLDLNQSGKTLAITKNAAVSLDGSTAVRKWQSTAGTLRFGVANDAATVSVQITGTNVVLADRTEDATLNLEDIGTLSLNGGRLGFYADGGTALIAVAAGATLQGKGAFGDNTAPSILTNRGLISTSTGASDTLTITATKIIPTATGSFAVGGATGTLTLDGVVTDLDTGGPFTMNSATQGTIVLAKANTYTGGTNVTNAGTLTGTAAGAFGTGAVSVTKGTMNFNYFLDTGAAGEPTQFAIDGVNPAAGGKMYFNQGATLDNGTLIAVTGNGQVLTATGSAGKQLTLTMKSGSAITVADAGTVDITHGVTMENGSSVTVSGGRVNLGKAGTGGGSWVHAPINIQAGALVKANGPGAILALYGQSGTNDPVTGNLTFSGDAVAMGGGRVILGADNHGSFARTYLTNTATLTSDGTGSRLDLRIRSGTTTLNSTNVGSITVKNGGALGNLSNNTDLVIDTTIQHEGTWILSAYGSNALLINTPANVTSDTTGLILESPGAKVKWSAVTINVGDTLEPDRIRVSLKGGRITISENSAAREWRYNDTTMYVVQGWGTLGGNSGGSNPSPYQRHIVDPTKAGVQFYATDGAATASMLTIEGSIVDDAKIAQYRLGDGDTLRLWGIGTEALTIGTGKITRDASAGGSPTLDLHGGVFTINRDAFDTTNGPYVVKITGQVYNGNTTRAGALISDFTGLDDAKLDQTVAAPLVIENSAGTGTPSPIGYFRSTLPGGSTFTVPDGKTLGYRGQWFFAADGQSVLINGGLDLNGILGAYLRGDSTGTVRLDGGEVLELAGGGNLGGMTLVYRADAATSAAALGVNGAGTVVVIPTTTTIGAYGGLREWQATAGTLVVNTTDPTTVTIGDGNTLSLNRGSGPEAIGILTLKGGAFETGSDGTTTTVAGTFTGYGRYGPAGANTDVFLNNAKVAATSGQTLEIAAQTIDASGGGVWNPSGGTIVLNGNLTGAAYVLDANTTGTLVLAKDNTYGGGTTVTAGTLQINALNSLGTGAVVVGGGDAKGTLRMYLGHDGASWGAGQTYTLANNGVLLGIADEVTTGQTRLVNRINVAMAVADGATVNVQGNRGFDSDLEGTVFYTDIRLGDGSLVQMVTTNNARLLANYSVADGATATVTNSDVATNILIGDISGPGHLIVGGTVQTKMVGTLYADYVNTDSTGGVSLTSHELGAATIAFSLNGNTLNLRGGNNDIYVDPGLGTINLTSDDGIIRLYKGQDGATNTLPQTTINLGNYRMLRPFSDEVTTGNTPLVNQITAPIVIAAGDAATLKSNRGFDTDLPGKSYITNLQMGDGATVQLDCENNAGLVVDLTAADGTTINATSVTGNWVYVKDVNGLGNVVLEGTNAMQLVGALNASVLHVTNTAGVSLTSTTLGVTATQFSLAGHTLNLYNGVSTIYVDPDGGTVNVVGSAKAAIYLGHDGATNNLANTKFIATGGGTVRGIVDGVGANIPQTINAITAPVSIPDYGRLDSVHNMNITLDGVVYFKDVTLADGATLGITRVNDTIAADLKLIGNAAVLNDTTDFGATTVYIGNVVGDAGTTNHLLTAVGGPQLKFIGQISNTNLKFNTTSTVTFDDLRTTSLGQQASLVGPMTIDMTYKTGVGATTDGMVIFYNGHDGVSAGNCIGSNVTYLLDNYRVIRVMVDNSAPAGAPMINEFAATVNVAAGAAGYVQVNGIALSGIPGVVHAANLHVGDGGTIGLSRNSTGSIVGDVWLDGTSGNTAYLRNTSDDNNIYLGNVEITNGGQTPTLTLAGANRTTLVGKLEADVILGNNTATYFKVDPRDGVSRADLNGHTVTIADSGTAGGGAWIDMYVDPTITSSGTIRQVYNQIAGDAWQEGGLVLFVNADGATTAPWGANLTVDKNGDSAIGLRVREVALGNPALTNTFAGRVNINATSTLAAQRDNDSDVRGTAYYTNVHMYGDDGNTGSKTLKLSSQDEGILKADVTLHGGKERMYNASDDTRIRINTLSDVGTTDLTLAGTKYIHFIGSMNANKVIVGEGWDTLGGALPGRGWIDSTANVTGVTNGFDVKANGILVVEAPIGGGTYNVAQGGQVTVASDAFTGTLNVAAGGAIGMASNYSYIAAGSEQILITIPNYNGTLTLNSNTVQIGAAVTDLASMIRPVKGTATTVSFKGGDTYVGADGITVTRMLTVGSGDGTTMISNLGGATSVVMDRNLTIVNPNAYTGGTSVTTTSTTIGNTVTVRNAAGLGTGNVALTAASSAAPTKLILDANGFTLGASAITVGANSTLALRKNAAANIVFSGGTIEALSTVVASGALTDGVVPAFVTHGDGLTFSGNLAMTADRTWTIGLGDTVEFGGNVTGKKQITKAGEGTLRLTGANDIGQLVIGTSPGGYVVAKTWSDAATVQINAGGLFAVNAADYAYAAVNKTTSRGVIGLAKDNAATISLDDGDDFNLSTLSLGAYADATFSGTLTPDRFTLDMVTYQYVYMLGGGPGLLTVASGMADQGAAGDTTMLQIGSLANDPLPRGTAKLTGTSTLTGGVDVYSHLIIGNANALPNGATLKVYYGGSVDLSNLGPNLVLNLQPEGIGNTGGGIANSGGTLGEAQLAALFPASGDYVLGGGQVGGTTTVLDGALKDLDGGGSVKNVLKIGVDTVVLGTPTTLGASENDYSGLTTAIKGGTLLVKDPTSLGATNTLDVYNAGTAKFAFADGLTVASLAGQVKIVDDRPVLAKGYSENPTVEVAAGKTMKVDAMNIGATSETRGQLTGGGTLWVGADSTTAAITAAAGTTPVFQIRDGTLVTHYESTLPDRAFHIYGNGTLEFATATAGNNSRIGWMEPGATLRFGDGITFDTTVNGQSALKFDVDMAAFADQGTFAYSSPAKPYTIEVAGTATPVRLYAGTAGGALETAQFTDADNNLRRPVAYVRKTGDGDLLVRQAAGDPAQSVARKLAWIVDAGTLEGSNIGSSNLGNDAYNWLYQANNSKYAAIEWQHLEGIEVKGGATLSWRSPHGFLNESAWTSTPDAPGQEGNGWNPGEFILWDGATLRSVEAQLDLGFTVPLVPGANPVIETYLAYPTIKGNNTTTPTITLRGDAGINFRSGIEVDPLTVPEYGSSGQRLINVRVQSGSVKFQSDLASGTNGGGGTITNPGIDKIAELTLDNGTGATIYQNHNNLAKTTLNGSNLTFDPGTGKAIAYGNGSATFTQTDGEVRVSTGTINMGASVLACTVTTPDYVGYVPGLLSGTINHGSGSGPSLAANPGNVGIELGPTKGNLSSNAPLSNFGSNPNYTTYVYTGYYYEDDGNVSFGKNWDDAAYVAVDGQVVINNATYTTASYGTLTGLAVGWHQIDIRFGQGTGGAGASGNPWTLTPPAGVAIGFGYDPLGRGSTSQMDYIIPLDPGNGSLFRMGNIAGVLTVASGSTLNAGGFTGFNMAEVVGTAGMGSGPAEANVFLVQGSVTAGAAKANQFKVTGTANLASLTGMGPSPAVLAETGSSLTVTGAGGITGFQTITSKATINATTGPANATTTNVGENLPGQAVAGSLTANGGAAGQDLMVKNGTANYGTGAVAMTGDIVVGSEYRATVIVDNWQPGLSEGRVSGNNNWTAYPTTTVGQLGPRVGLGPLWTTSGSSGGLWIDNSTMVYQGQILIPDNNGNGTGTFAFAENFDDSIQVKVDLNGDHVLNEVVLVDTASGTASWDTAYTTTAGWHDIEIRFGQAGGKVGGNWTGGLGFVMDLTLPIVGGTTYTNYDGCLMDNGTMNLFKYLAGVITVDPGSVAATGTFTAGNVTAVNLDIKNGSASIADLTATGMVTVGSTTKTGSLIADDVTADVFHVTNGSASLNSLTAAGGGISKTTTIDAGQTLTVAQAIREMNQVNVYGNVQTGTANNLTKALAFGGTPDAPSGQWDLTDGNLIIDYEAGATPMADVVKYVKAGRNAGSGYWDGQGLMSSDAAAATLTALGVIDNNGLDSVKDTLEGQAVDHDAILIKYTYLGDNNLDGKVDWDNDFLAFQNGVLFGIKNNNNWLYGDYNYDGAVDWDNDFLAFQNGILFQGGPLGGVGQGSELGSVPEPATLTLLVLGAVAMVARRRRSAR